ncbi:CPBP family intramembrane glutamic endopeptidase [Flavobacterium gawalongense]|uniref:CPBP family intramembrane metalloprotease n=1 Tax=Flavobacterium gawalongense TaxID=2594432 RepID=A0A553B953_9FLAO|nr:CPBP family intramembrane glutamic endopeptidase [Flavobacterium gawalongense]TRW95623.1 CPBP family intramembrane metalloprotease [Flavobacterium gawalongense]TRX00379.1 CPBP family intramembrane metalloprotease [Flavobacterium gawalongense]TRX04788.1 CPBP family intramembrane metalloprotease [Flavobacterium gawalongense]TRX07056.1 CPBP family intramembrane metalloprotease [Flavobacterium gawalongense]TRX23174.1 CPBP family intramembrane metalloprotease [Flavobacterium gawalongense]
MEHLEQTKPISRRTKKAVLDAVVCSVEIMAFAYLITYPFPLKAVAFIPLVMVAFIISRDIDSPSVTFRLLFRDLFSLKMLVQIVIGLELGIIAAIYYRGNLGMPLLPSMIRPFVFVAASVAIIEELFFRGFIQGQINKINSDFAVVFAALAHASYKACLFLSPAAIQQQHLVAFFIWSFAAYIVLGFLKHYSKSMIPVIVTHVIFDIVVYAEVLQAPWWVW